MSHRIVTISRDLDFRTEAPNESGVRCANCGLVGKWDGDLVFDEPCNADPLPFPEAS